MLSDLRRRKLTRLFDAFDGDHDGVLTSKDPEIVVQRLAKLGELDPASDTFTTFKAGFMFYMEDLMRSADADGDGKVTLQEWVGYHEQMLQDKVRFQATAEFSAGLMFTLVDRDGDGRISLEEYGGWLRAWNVDEAALTADVFDHLDVNGDGTLSRDEVVAMTRDFYYSDDPDAAGNWAMGPF